MKTKGSCFFVYILCSSIYTVCALKDNDVRNYLGTRTPYRYKYNKDDTKIKYPSCKDTKVWMMIRHGTRLPSSDDIVMMNGTLKDLKYEILVQNKLGNGGLNIEQLKALEEWSSSLNVNEEKHLTYEGQEEMTLLAERMQKRFPNTIRNKYNNKTFLFRYTATQRAQQSARYFTLGLFDKRDSQDVIYAPATKVDTVLRFYKYCDKWQKQVRKNPNTYYEQTLFGQSLVMNRTLEVVSKKLGLNHILSLDMVSLIYKTCGYETAWSKHRTSPWCYAFDKETAETLEYYHDLKTYWKDGYGHDLNHRQACHATKHLFQTFTNNESPNATFLFAHSGTVLKLLSHLQLYKPDVPLRGDHIVRDRPWKSTDIDCFASNIAFVLFKCKDEDKVLTLHQERVVKMPMCDQELCPLKQIKKYFHDSLLNCDYNEMCSMRSNDVMT